MRTIQPSIFPARKRPEKVLYPERNIVGVVLVLLAFLAFGALVANGAEKIIVIATHDLDSARPAETIALPWTEVATRLPGVISSELAVKDAAGHLVPAQVTNSQPENKGHADALIFQHDFAAGEKSATFTIEKAVRPAPPFSSRVLARLVPERQDDFAWENDRIAHRVFGKALETWKAEPLTSSGFDVWIKRTRGLVINDLYRTMKFFDANGPAQDDYRVGKTRGDGGLGVWRDSKLYVSANWRGYKILGLGPVRAEFELTYDAWDAGGRMISETKRISLDAGSNLSRVESTFHSDDKSPVQIGVGLAERPGDNVIVQDGAPQIDSWQSSTASGLVVQNRVEGWMAYWQPQDFDKGTTAVAFVLPKGSVQAFTVDDPGLPAAKFAPPTKTQVEGQQALRNLLAIAPAEIGTPLVYDFGAGWDKSGDFPDAKSWTAYVRNFAERRDHPLKISCSDAR